MTKYIVAYSNITQDGEDVTTKLQDAFKKNLNELGVKDYKFSTTILPYVGEMNLFTVPDEETAERFYTTMENGKEKGLEMCLFPVHKDQRDYL